MTAREETAAAEIRVGILGLGFMGRTHAAAYRAAARAGSPNRIVAVHDRDRARLRGERRGEGNLRTGDEGAEPAWADARLHASPRALLEDPEVELVSICTPTDTHVELATTALSAGKDVLVEKPVSLDAAECERLAAVARESGRLCMPAMCMRFWPGWSWLKRAVASGELGPVRSAVFRRLGTRPGWSPGFYEDAGRSGGALFDLHVHDADLVRWLFGTPATVCTGGSLDHVTTQYRFADGPAHVVAEGGWDHAPDFPFFMGYTVVFERATAEWRIDRDPSLVVAGTAPAAAAAEDPTVTTGYDGEVRHVLAACRARRAGEGFELGATIEEASALLRMLAAERRSLDSGRPERP